MNKLIVPFMVLMLSGSVFADNHKSNKDLDGSHMNHPNHLLDFKQCKKTKDGVAAFLVMADKAWIEAKENPDNDKKWAKASFLSSQASHYSTVYDVWCKDIVNKRVKMGMSKRMKEKKKKG